MDSKSILNKIKNYDISAKKFYGQNFLFDENILRKIVEKSHIKDKINILEIGSFYGNAAGAFYYYFKNSKIFFFNHLYF